MIPSAVLSLCCQTLLQTSDSFEGDKVLIQLLLCLKSCLFALRDMGHAITQTVYFSLTLATENIRELNLEEQVYVLMSQLPVHF